MSTRPSAPRGSAATVQKASPAPTLPGRPVLGSMRELRRDYLETIERAAREGGGLVRISAGPPGWRVVLHVVSSPELAAQVLGQPDRFRKEAPGYRELRAALGDGLLTSQDADWRRQRRLLAPVFTPRRVAGYADVISEEAGRLVERWRAAASSGAGVDAYPEMARVAAQVIGRLLFGSDVSRATDQLVRFAVVNDALLRRAVSPHPVPRSWPTPGNRRLDAELARLRRVVDTLVARRRAQPRSSTPAADGRPDLLGLLLAAGTAEDAPLRDTEVTDQVLVFLLAGLETTAVTLSCALVQLALDPAWQQVVRDEVGQVSPGRVPTGADVGSMVWTARVLREVMRLYPAAHGIARRTAAAEVLGGFAVPAGSWLEVSPWAVHHSPAVWAEPATFDPRRFDLPADQVPGGHRHAWMPFGAGPHVCVGLQLAMLEMQVVLGAVLGAFVVETPLRCVPVHAAITLQPSGALPLRLRAV